MIMTKKQINEGALLMGELLHVFVNEMKQQGITSDMLDIECLPTVYSALKEADELVKLVSEGCKGRKEMMEAKDN